MATVSSIVFERLIAVLEVLAGKVHRRSLP